jgi:hypothetical protein
MALNKALIEQRGLDKRSVKKLKTLHALMDSLVDQQNAFHDMVGMSKKDTKRLRRVVLNMEYMMQEQWGFPENKGEHTHYMRFTALNPLRGQTVSGDRNFD